MIYLFILLAGYYVFSALYAYWVLPDYVEVSPAKRITMSLLSPGFFLGVAAGIFAWPLAEGYEAGKDCIQAWVGELDAWLDKYLVKKEKAPVLVFPTIVKTGDAHTEEQ